VGVAVPDDAGLQANGPLGGVALPAGAAGCRHRLRLHRDARRPAGPAGPERSRGRQLTERAHSDTGTPPACSP